MIDRLAPTYRPLGWPINYQRWHHLLFLHWAVPAAALRPLVPARLSLDLHEGVAYVGIVAFAVEDARPTSLPSGVGLRFLETNVRTYVHLDGQAPGIYFFSLDAASALAVLGARVGFGLPYCYARMRARCRDDQVDYALRRRWPGRPRFAVRYERGEVLGPSPPGTLDHFLLERYQFHVERRGGLWTTQVHHRPYPVQRARVLAVDADELLVADGLPPATGAPLVHYASRVDVDVFAPRLRRSQAQALQGAARSGSAAGDPGTRHERVAG